MAKIITLTMNPTLDKSATIDKVVAGRKLRCDPPRFEPGGGGINVSRAIQRLGGSSTAIYPVGGPTGEMLRQLLERSELKQHCLHIENLTRQNLTVIEDSGGRQFRFGMPGPELKDEEWRRCLEFLADADARADYIVASGSLPRGVPADFYARVARLARETGSRVIVDSSKDALRAAANEGVFLLKPNMRELGQLADRKIESEEHQESVAQRIIEKGQASVVVVSLGAAGALLVTEEKTERLRAPTVPIESRIGAGDSMVAGVVLSLARGKSVEQAVRFGVAAGSAAVMTPGTELCRREDTERLYEQMA